MIDLNSMRGEFVGDGIPRTAGGRVGVTGHEPTSHAKDGARWPPIPETEPFPESELVRNREFIQRCRTHTEKPRTAAKMSNPDPPKPAYG